MAFRKLKYGFELKDYKGLLIKPIRELLLFFEKNPDRFTDFHKGGLRCGKKIQWS